MKCLYLHIDNNENVFYCGSGNKRRPYSFHAGRNRSEEWISHREKFGLKEVKIISWHETKELAFYNEEMMTDALREYGHQLVNKFSGRRMDDDTKQKNRDAHLGVIPSEQSKQKMRDNSWNTGKSFETPAFKGITLAKNCFNKIVVFDGEKSMKVRGFNSGHVSSCLNGNLKSHLGFSNFQRTTDRGTLEALLSVAEFYDEESKEILIRYLNSPLNQEI